MLYFEVWYLARTCSTLVVWILNNVTDVRIIKTYLKSSFVFFFSVVFNYTTCTPEN
jgi:hypothetical protein